VLDLIRELLGLRKRRQKRVPIPAMTLTIEGKAYETENWSLSGFHLNKLRRAVKVGEKIEGQIGDLGYSSGGGFSASVVRLSEDGGFGACWSDIDRDIFTAMSGFGG